MLPRLASAHPATRRQAEPPVGLCSPSRRDADPVPLEADDVSVLQLPSTSTIHLAVHGDVTVGDGLFDISTGVEQPGELQELPEADAVTVDGDVVDRSSVRHPRMLVGP